MKILVTGGLGFVGINIVRGLAAQPGVQVVAADVLGWDCPGGAATAAIGAMANTSATSAIQKKIGLACFMNLVSLSVFVARFGLFFRIQPRVKIT